MILPALRSAMESLRVRKHFLKLVVCGAGSRQWEQGRKTITTPPAWQDPRHSRRDLFRLEHLDSAERQRLGAQSEWKKNPDFPWDAFAKALNMDTALPLAILNLFGLYFPDEPRPDHHDRQLLHLACWGDEASWLALIELGRQCHWSHGLMRSLLANQDLHSAIAPPIRMLAEPYRRHASLPRKKRGVLERTYSYCNFREIEEFQAWRKKKVTLEPLLKRALEEDAIFQAEISTSVSRHPRSDVFAAALIDHLCPRLLCDWLLKYSEAELGLNHRDIAKFLLLRVEDLQPITQVLTTLEKQRPGFVRTVMGEDGCNLLWFATPPAARGYTRHTTDTDFPPDSEQLPLYKFLIGEMGVSPLQRNKRGFCFADYDLVARAIGQRNNMVGLYGSEPGFDDRQFWGIDRFENEHAF